MYISDIRKIMKLGTPYLYSDDLNISHNFKSEALSELYHRFKVPSTTYLSVLIIGGVI